MSDTVKFTITCEMKARWVPHFMSMLKRMQYLGAVGSSRKVALYADGDGDFRPKFEADIEYEEQDPISGTGGSETGGDHLYDAG